MTSKSLLPFFIFVCVLQNASAQAPSIEWQKCYGGSAGESGTAVQETRDGGFLVLANTISNDGEVSGNHSPAGVTDLWMIKIDTVGGIVWSKCYGGSNFEMGNSFSLTPDQGFIIGGFASSIDGDLIGSGNHGNGDFWLVKCDSIGTIEWQKCFGGSGEEECFQIACTYDKGFIAVGYTFSNDSDLIGANSHDSSLCNYCSDVWVVKLDSTGAIQWSKNLGGSYDERGYSIFQTPDSGYVLASTTSSNDGDVSGNHSWQVGYSSDYWIVKLNQTGDVQWQKCRGGGADEGHGPNILKIIPSMEGGFTAIGYTESHDDDVSGIHGNLKDAWVFKLDPFGNLLWQKCLGGFDLDYGTSVVQLLDSTYLILSVAFSIDGDVTNNHSPSSDAWLVRLDFGGNLVWAQCYGGSDLDGAFDLKSTSDEGLIVAGYTLSNDGDVSGNHGSEDVWIVKLTPLPDEINSPANSITDFTCYLNQVNQTISVNFYANGNEHPVLQLFDLTGRELFQQPLDVVQGFNKLSVQTGPLSSGIYFARLLLTANAGVTKKLVVTSN